MLLNRFCAGGEVLKILERRKKFSEKDAANIMKELLSAVIYCHNNNVIHRNIKPESLLFDSNDKNATLKVINFGMSEIMDPDMKMLLKVEEPLYVAPGVQLKNYDEKCDVWSCGVMLYILLSGTVPFTGATRNELCHNIQRGIFSITGQRWDAVSSSARELVKMMMIRDKAKRCTAFEALNHPWIKDICKEELDTTEAKHLLNKLRSFKIQCKFQEAALSYIVSQLTTNKEKRHIQSVFLLLDKNKDGRLERDELIQGYKKLFGKNYPIEKEIESIMENVDITGDGYIDYTEFLIATINKKTTLTKDRLIIAFNRFDVDGSGTISLETIKDIFKYDLNTSSGIPLKERHNEAKKESKELKVTFEEFLAVMSKLIESE